jgi:hypothetical protein
MQYHTVGTGTLLKQQIYDYENEEVNIKYIYKYKTDLLSLLAIL